MEDLSEYWKMHRDIKQRKKASNLEKSTAILDIENIAYIKLSAYHYRLSEYDFWPSTGKFIHRQTGVEGRGIISLLKRIKSGKNTVKS